MEWHTYRSTQFGQECIESKGGLSLGEAICHGPWAPLYIIVMGRPIMQGPDESLPRPFLSIVFAMSTLRDEAMFSLGDKEQAYLLLAMKEMDSLSSVILGCDMNLCRRSIHLGPSTLTSWGLGWVKRTNTNRMLMLLMVPWEIKAFASDPGISCFLPASRFIY